MQVKSNILEKLHRSLKKKNGSEFVWQISKQITTGCRLYTANESTD